jgi:hypothetical protein
LQRTILRRWRAKGCHCSSDRFLGDKAVISCAPTHECPLPTSGTHCGHEDGADLVYGKMRHWLDTHLIPAAPSLARSQGQTRVCGVYLLGLYGQPFRRAQRHWWGLRQPVRKWGIKPVDKSLSSHETSDPAWKFFLSLLIFFSKIT